MNSTMLKNLLGSHHRHCQKMKKTDRSKWHDIDSHHRHCQKMKKTDRSKSQIFDSPARSVVLTTAGPRTMGTPWAKNYFKSTYGGDFAGRQAPAPPGSSTPAVPQIVRAADVVRGEKSVEDVVRAAREKRRVKSSGFMLTMPSSGASLGFK